MPTKIVQLELKNPSLTTDGFEGYDQALVLARYGGRPVGQFNVAVVDGRISAAEVHQKTFEIDPGPIWNRVVQEFLDWEPEGAHLHRPKASVVVVTRERPEDLRRCLDGLRALPDDGQEIVVVDNRPETDATLRLVGEYDPHVRYVREDSPGEGAARNCGLREARHDIVAFIDDDAVPDSGWLRGLVRNFRDPQVLAVTGLVMPLELETRAQEVFEKHSPHGRGFVRRVFAMETDYVLHAGPIGVSANVAVRRDVPEVVGPFDEVLGVGTPARCGTDHELFVRMLRSGYHIVYDPAALNWHRHRRTWPELRRVLGSYGVGVYAHWTRLLLFEREPSVILLGFRWFWYRQLPDLVRALRRTPGHAPLDLILAQLWGCCLGPFAYFKSRRERRANGWAS